MKSAQQYPRQAPAADELDPGHLADPELREGLSRLARDNRRWRELEEVCQRLHSIDFHLLSLADYPDEEALRGALHVRIFWLLAGFTMAALLVLSIMGYLPPWTGGISGAAAFLMAVMYRINLVPGLPSAHEYLELLEQRKRTLRDVRRYIHHLEGRKGFIFRLLALSDFNPNLEDTQFRKLCVLSQQGRLSEFTKSLNVLYLYHQFLEECLQAERMMREVEEDSNRERANSQS